jgi:hypothetical protein
MPNRAGADRLDNAAQLDGVSAPSEAWRFLQGVSPCGVRSNQPLLPSVAAVKEAEDRRTTQPKRTQGTT